MYVKNPVLIGLVALSSVLSACDQLAESTSSHDYDNPAQTVDFTMLGSSPGIAKAYEKSTGALGEHASKAYEVDFSIKHGGRHPDRPDRFDVDVSYQDPGNEHQLQVSRWDSAYAKWSTTPAKIDVKGRKAESFRLANQLFDMNAITVEFLQDAVKAGSEKYLNSEKYSEQYVSAIGIDKRGVSIHFEGLLAANGQEKSETYKVKLPKSK